MKRFLAVLLALAISGLGLTAVPASAANQLVSHSIDCAGSTTSQDGLTYTIDGTTSRAYVQLPGTAPVDVSITLTNCPYYYYNNGYNSGTISGLTSVTGSPYTFTVPAGFTGEGGGRVGLTFFYIYFVNVPSDEVTVEASPAEGGSGSSTDLGDGTWGLSATVNPGYSFVSWSCDNGGVIDNSSAAETTVFFEFGGSATCTATFQLDEGVEEEFSITSLCTFNAVKNLVLNVSSGNSYEIREQGAGLENDPILEYHAWVEFETPSGFTGISSPASVSGDQSFTLTYDEIAVYLDGLGTDTLTWQFYPVVLGEVDWEKSGDTPACSVTFNREPAIKAQGLGYWKTTGLFGLDLTVETVNLGTYSIDSFSKASGVFNATNCGVKNYDALGCLAGHLLTAKFNVLAGVDAVCVATTIADADAFLIDRSYTGPSKSPRALNKSQRSQAISLKNNLEYFNENGCNLVG